MSRFVNVGFASFVLLSAVAVSAQSFPSAPSTVELNRETSRTMAEKTGQTYIGLEPPKRKNDRDDVRIKKDDDDVSFVYKPGLTKADIQAISIFPEDLKAFKEFLKQPKTGIIRLHRADVCSTWENVVQANSTCPNNVTGKATGYSFRAENYREKSLADVFFSEDVFSAPGALTLGIFAPLGDVSLDNLAFNNDVVKSLAQFAVPTKQVEVEEQFSKLRKGMQVGSHVYQGQIQLKENESFALRTIAYRGKAFRNDGRGKTNVLAGDQRDDLLVAFRVIRKHYDGSVTLLWKELQRSKAPELEIAKNQN